MPPAPKTDRASEGLVLQRVAGAYDRGGKRTNLIEAEAVANAVAAHARTSANLSLGIVTFSSAQRDAIEDLLRNQTTQRRAGLTTSCARARRRTSSLRTSKTFRGTSAT